MGLKDFIASTVDLSKVDTGIVGLAQHGIIGNMLINDAKKIQEEKESQPKPGKYCERLCPVGGNCQKCLEHQQRYEQLLHELEGLEDAFENPQVSQAKKITECYLCGAPYEKGEKMCPYCDTSYPSDGIGFDIPQSKHEQTQILVSKAAEVYNEYYTFWNIANNNRQGVWKDKVPGLLQGVTNSFTGKIDSMMKLTPEQIANGAKKHNLRLSVYICGLTDGSIQSENMEKLEEQRRQLQEYSKQQQELHEKNMQIERERQEKLRKINQERNTAMGNLVYSKHVDWSCNSTTQDCWTCYYYNRPSNTCTRTNTKSDASHCCVFWK